MSLEPCTSSQEQAADCWLTSYSDTNQLSLLSGIDTPVRSCESEPVMDGFQICTCGKGMSDCLIHPTTPDEWIASMQDSLAKILASQASKLDLARRHVADCTDRSFALLATYDLNTSSWKTSQRSLVPALEVFTGTWPRSVMTSGNAAYALPMLERFTIETDGGACAKEKKAIAWATPTTMDYLPSRSYEAMKRQATNGGRKNRSRPGNLREQIDPLMCQAYQEAKAEANKMQYWMTPTANIAMHSGEVAWKKGQQLRLTQQVNNPHLWPTPTARDWKGGRSPEALAAAGRKPSNSLPDYINHSQQATGQLNPDWVEWLMGWPIGWTGLKQLETGRSRYRQRSRSKCLNLSTEANNEKH